MNGHTRRAVAYIAGSIVSGATSGSLYDHEAAREYEFPGEVSREYVAVRDREKGCDVGGILPSLYHHGHGNHLTLEISGGDFTGHDYGSGYDFGGSVVGTEVSIDDRETESRHRYELTSGPGAGPDSTTDSDV